jgi:hypothetical protein
MRGRKGSAPAAAAAPPRSRGPRRPRPWRRRPGGDGRALAPANGGAESLGGSGETWINRMENHVWNILVHIRLSTHLCMCNKLYVPYVFTEPLITEPCMVHGGARRRRRRAPGADPGDEGAAQAMQRRDPRPPEVRHVRAERLVGPQGCGQGGSSLAQGWHAAVQHGRACYSCEGYARSVGVGRPQCTPAPARPRPGSGERAPETHCRAFGSVPPRK